MLMHRNGSAILQYKNSNYPYVCSNEGPIHAPPYSVSYSIGFSIHEHIVHVSNMGVIVPKYIFV
jgi:hypothetical protein